MLTLKQTESMEEEKQVTLKDLAEREERIFNIEKKLSRSSIIETTLDMNQVIELKVGGKIFFTTLVTLKSVKDTYFTSYFSDHFKPIPLKDGSYPIDRPSNHFELILNHLRGKNIKERIQELNDRDLYDFIEEVVYYQITPIYDLLPPKGKKLLSTEFGIELKEIVKFDQKYCSSIIKLESETRASCSSAFNGTVLGTKSNSFKVKLISNCQYLYIGFAPKSIDVNSSYKYEKDGYYLYCSLGKVYSQNRDQSYINSRINDGSIVECLFDEENGTISYKVDGISYGIAFSNILINNDVGSDDELFPAFNVYGQDCVFELINE